jgi:acyl dehydratase
MPDDQPSPPPATPRATVGDSFSQDVAFEAAAISAFATSCGDPNPIHHDPAFAAGTRFGGIIACGPHVTALFMAMTASHFAATGPLLGLGFSFRLRSAIRAGETVTMRWEVVGVDPKPTLGGNIVALRGRVTRPGGTVAVTASGEVLLVDRL